MYEPKRNSANLFARECIVDGLLRLIQEKPLSGITISELCKVAGVSRMTFYRNYNSKEEVFSSYLEEIIEDYQSDEKEILEGGIYCDVEHLTHCFSYFFKHKNFLEGVFHCGFGNIFLERLTEYIEKKWGNGKNHYELRAFAGSLYSLYIGWSEKGCKESADEMAEILSKIYQ